MNTASNIIDLKIIKEGHFEIIHIDTNEQYTQYSAMPLLTCFAYLMLYRSQANALHAVLYHAESSVLRSLPAIFEQIEHEYNVLDKIIVAIPNAMTDTSTADIIKENNAAFADTFQVNSEDLPITIIENAQCYAVDTYGSHGITIPGSSNLVLIGYLKELRKELAHAQFTIKNWLPWDVPGMPREITELKIEMAKLSMNIEKTPEKLLEKIVSNISDMFDNFMHDQALVNERTKKTNDFLSLNHNKLKKLQDTARPTRPSPW